VKDREEVLEAPRVAAMEEVNAFWTQIMRDKEQATKDRLKASELRARAAGGFVEHVNVSGQLNTGQLDNVLAQLREDSGDG
jgi:phage terminase small subunit